MTDTGSLPIKIGKKVDAKGYSIGMRSDGASIVFKPEDANSRNVKAWNVTSCMIDKLKHTGMISLDQYDAASRFLDVFVRSTPFFSSLQRIMRNVHGKVHEEWFFGFLFHEL